MPQPTTALAPQDLERLRADHPDLRVIDVRTPGEFAVRHLPGSANVPLPDLRDHRSALTSAEAGPVVLVCESGARAGTAERQLADAGLTHVHVLDGGVAAWERSGRALVRPDAAGAPWALERQVRLVAGGIVATSTLASLFWPPARVVAGAVGTGLVVAAVTNTCAMGTALGRLPYNRSSRPACDLPSAATAITRSSEGDR